MEINVSRICPKSVNGIKPFQLRMKIKVKTNKFNVSRICPKNVTGMKTFQTRIKLKVKKIENHSVSEFSKKRQRDENIPNADAKKVKRMKINVSRICPQSVKGMKAFRMRMKMIVKTKKNQSVSDLSKGRQWN